MLVEDFIYEQEGETREILQFFHDLLTMEWQLEAKIRYKIPFYYRKSWICYLNPQKAGGVEWTFTRGNELSNAQGLLESKGRKQIMGKVFMNVQEIPQDMVREILQEAILLDDSVPYASKRKKKG